MAQWLRTLVGLAEDPVSQYQPGISKPSVIPGNLTSSSSLLGHQVSMWYTIIHAGKIFLYITK